MGCICCTPPSEYRLAVFENELLIWFSSWFALQRGALEISKTIFGRRCAAGSPMRGLSAHRRIGQTNVFWVVSELEIWFGSQWRARARAQEIRHVDSRIVTASIRATCG